MRVVVYTPFGSGSQESGVIYLAANYLLQMYPDIEVYQLTCNGVFHVCDRDADTNWQRDTSHCSRCIQDQASLADWCNMEQLELSSFILPEDIQGTKEWVDSFETEELLEADVGGVKLAEVLGGTLRTKVGVQDLVGKPGPTERRFQYQLALSTARALLAAGRFQKTVKPDLTLLAGGRDFITASYRHSATQNKIPVSVLSWDINKRTVHIEQPMTGRKLDCPLLLEDITNTRSDVSTWPDELVELVVDVLAFLGISNTQLRLPIG